jgi:hypothetical protein
MLYVVCHVICHTNTVFYCRCHTLLLFFNAFIPYYCLFILYRVNEAIKSVGMEAFFTIHYELFADALEHNRPDFLLEFLPHSRAGLVKCNSLNHIQENEEFVFSSKDENNIRDPNLLMRAIILGNRAVISIVVDCWCKFLGELPTSDADPLYDLLGDDYFQLEVNICMCIIYIYVWMYLYVCIYMNVCMYVYMFIYILAPIQYSI